MRGIIKLYLKEIIWTSSLKKAKADDIDSVFEVFDSKKLIKLAIEVSELDYSMPDIIDVASEIIKECKEEAEING